MFINLIHKYYNDNKYEILENCIADFLKTLKIIKDKKLSQEFYLKLMTCVLYNKDVKNYHIANNLSSSNMKSFAHNLVTTEDFRKIIKMSKIFNEVLIENISNEIINNKSIEFNNAESLFIFMSKFSQFPKSTEKMLELRLKNTPIDKDKTHSKIISSLFNLTYEKEKIL